MAKGRREGPVNAQGAPQAGASAEVAPKPASDAERLAVAIVALRQVAAHLVSRAEGDTALASRIMKLLGDG